LLDETSSLNLLLAWVDQCSPTFQQNNKCYKNDKKEWVSEAISHRFINMYVLDTVYNDWASTACPAGMSGEHFCVILQRVLFFTVGMNCCRGQRSGTVYMGQIRLKCPTLKRIHCYTHYCTSWVVYIVRHKINTENNNNIEINKQVVIHWKNLNWLEAVPALLTSNVESWVELSTIKNKFSQRLRWCLNLSHPVDKDK